jgi:hypothetical protein
VGHRNQLTNLKRDLAQDATVRISTGFSPTYRGLPVQDNRDMAPYYSGISYLEDFSENAASNIR